MASLFDTFLSALIQGTGTQDLSRSVALPETPIRPEMQFPETVIPPSMDVPIPPSWDISDADIAQYDMQNGYNPAGGGNRNLIDLNNRQEALARNAPTMPAPDQMMPLPVPGKGEQAPLNLPMRDLGIVPVPGQAVAAGGRKKSPGTAAPAMAPLGDLTPASLKDEPKHAPAADMIADMLGKRRNRYSDDEAKARGEAVDADKMTDDDKLAFALLSALPGLIGLVGGGIAGGGLGAAQGLAGGLQGGAAGTQMIADAKTGKRKEALARADKASDRLAQVDNQELQHGEALQNQGFTAGQADKRQQFEAGQTEKTQKFQAGQTDKQIAAQHAENAANRGNALKIKEMDVMSDREKAIINAQKERGGNDKDFQVNSARWATRMMGSAPQIDAAEKQLTSLAGHFATKNAWVEAMANPKLKQAAASIGQYLSGILRKDSGAAITPDEWADAYRQYMPNVNDDAETLLFKQRTRKRETAAMYESAGPAQHIVQKAFEMVPLGGDAPQTTPASTQGKRVRQNGHVYEEQPDGSYKAVE
jgi:hypothetical protein